MENFLKNMKNQEKEALCIERAEMEKVDNTPRCWCGEKMEPIGRGKYPYDCIKKRRQPNAMVYVSGKCGHSSWTTE